jgi:protein-S-isoprenylcysteine O-methyltransferase Ste14
MNTLQLKIPPPIVAFVFGMLIWLLSDKLSLTFMDPEHRRTLALMLLAVAATLDIWAILSFRAAKTTIDPRYPHKSTSIVSTGIYQYTRNPMYLGLALILTALSVYLAAPLGFLCVLGFIVYINKFQIEAEEAMLEQQFGARYHQYKQSVRRWI